MRCPFLREAQVKYCRASAFRKMIVRLPGQPDNERCSSPDYVNCPAAKQHHEERPSLAHCTFLNESLVQYCAAASVTKYIPYSEAILSQCGTESHKYCELYLALANPEHASIAEAEVAGKNPNVEHLIEGIRVHDLISYSANHMWLEMSDDGYVHVGIDAFLAKLLGSIERLSFVTTKGVNRPTAVLTVHGVDLQMVFPNEIQITKPNSYLRTNPSKVFTDPYSLGWLFEGTAIKEQATKKEPSLLTGLLSGSAACSWMRDEVRRTSELVHKFSHHSDGNEKLLMADGGSFHHGIAQHLTRDELLHLFNEFFSPLATWRQHQ